MDRFFFFVFRLYEYQDIEGRLMVKSIMLSILSMLSWLMFYKIIIGY